MQYQQHLNHTTLFICGPHVASYYRFASLKLVGADQRSGSGGLRPFQWPDKGLGVKKASVLFFARIKKLKDLKLVE